jgi:two-component system sensor histidine kinase UhpB
MQWVSTRIFTGGEHAESGWDDPCFAHGGHDKRNDVRMHLSRSRPASLFWRVFGLNAVVFVSAGLLLALSPATVSSQITLSEATMLFAGIAGMLLINLALMRRSFAPLTDLATTMRRIDPLKPGQRVRFQAHDRELSELVASFNEMLDRLESERQASARREAQATDAEQRRIAAELHDEIGQRLTVLLLMLAHAEADANPITAARLDEVRLLAHEILDDLRSVVVRLRPAALDELGITNALTTLARTFEHQAGAPIVRDLHEPDGDVSPIVNLVVYRVAQEAMTNAVRHAPGSSIRLELTQDAESVLLRVQDSGPGITDAEADVSGSGLRFMAERAVLVGGRLDLDSTPAGTTVTLTVPLSETP